MSRHILKSFLEHHKTKTVIRMAVGWFFIVLGVIGIFLPILQGILFIAVGIALLADHIPIFAKIRNKIYHRFPKLKHLVRREHARLRLVRRRMRHKREERLRVKTNEDAPQKVNASIKWGIITAITVAAIIVPFIIFGERIDAWTEALIDGAQYNVGVIALILGGLLGSDILLPIPSSIASTACGLLLGLVLGTLVSLVGMVTSCVIGYFLAAKLGRPFVKRMVGAESMEHFQKLQAKHGFWVVVITRPVPVLAEIAVLSAGLGQIPFWRFLWLSTLSNLGISIVYAAIGAYSANLNAFMLAVAGSMILPGIGMLLMHRKTKI